MLISADFSRLQNLLRSASTFPGETNKVNYVLQNASDLSYFKSERFISALLIMTWKLSIFQFTLLPCSISRQVPDVARTASSRHTLWIRATLSMGVASDWTHLNSRKLKCSRHSTNYTLRRGISEFIFHLFFFNTSTSPLQQHYFLTTKEFILYSTFENLHLY